MSPFALSPNALTSHFDNVSLPGIGNLGQSLYLFVTSVLLAKLEIQIEGAHGWAENLPTWRVDSPRLRRATGGKPITGYHVYLNAVLLLFFHLCFWFQQWSVAAELNLLSTYLIFAVQWDFLWFVLNPAFGVRRFRPGCAWWFSRWVVWVPIDYVTGLLFSLTLAFAASLLGGLSPVAHIIQWFRDFIITAFLIGVCAGLVTLRDRHRTS